MTGEFAKILSSYQKAISRELEVFFGQRTGRPAGPFEKEVLSWLKEYSLREAKRLRAVLVNYGYFLAGGKSKKAILQTSIFIELIHNYLLIHDDILDKDELRRGKKAMHCLYGLDMAIVAGDMANALGYEVLSSAPFPVAYKLKALEVLNRTLYNTCYGQMLELDLRNKKRFTDRDILEIYTKKTAFYTLVAPLQIGALLGGANERFLNKIEKFALPLGMAFQVRDDLEDGDIEQVFHASKAKYQKMMAELVAKSKKVLAAERAFPFKEKQFLLALADYILERKK